jgi:hypothetical protein
LCCIALFCTGLQFFVSTGERDIEALCSLFCCLALFCAGLLLVYSGGRDTETVGSVRGGIVE